jgi:hypothetical protein
MATCLGRPRAPQGRSEAWAENALAMVAIGDWVMQIVAPQEHERLWLVGPAWLSRAKGIGWLAKNPRYTRLVGATQLGADVWFAVRQYGGT